MGRVADKSKVWVVERYDSATLEYEVRIPHSHITEDRLKEALRTLAAMESLTPDEVLGAYARRDRRSHKPILEVLKQYHPHTYAYTCGTNPFVVARLVEEAVESADKARKRRGPVKHAS